MGQWISLNVPEQKSADDSSMHTPTRPKHFVAPEFDPRSPTADYSRTPILVKSGSTSQDTTQNDENSSPVSALPPTANRPRSLHQRIVDKKRIEQTDS